MTKDIARNIAEAATGMQDANKRVSETSQAAAEVARETVGVDRAVGQMAEDSEQVQNSAVELSKVAGRLQPGVARFRAGAVDFNMPNGPIGARSGPGVAPQCINRQRKA